MVGRSSISALVALALLAALPASAHAARYTINVDPASPIVGQTVQFEAVRENGKGEGDTFSVTVVMMSHLTGTAGQLTSVRRPIPTRLPAAMK